MANPKPKINRDAVAQFLRVTKPFFVSSDKRYARVLVSAAHLLFHFG